MCGGAVSLAGGGLGGSGVGTSKQTVVGGVPAAVFDKGAGLVASKCSGAIVVLFRM